MNLILSELITTVGRIEKVSDPTIRASLFDTLALQVGHTKTEVEVTDAISIVNDRMKYQMQLNPTAMVNVPLWD